MTARSSITVTKVSRPSMKPLASFSNPSWSSTLASGWSARAAAMASWTLSWSAPPVDRDQGRGDQLRSGEGVLLRPG